MRATFAEKGTVSDGIKLYRCPSTGRRFLHFPPGTFLWVEPCCLDRPDVCHWDDDQATLWCCEPKRIGTGEIRFLPSELEAPRLVLVHFDRSLITFGPTITEPPGYTSTVGANFYTTGMYWESSHNNVPVGNNGQAGVDHEYWVLTTMLPGDHIKANFSLRDAQTHQPVARAEGDVVVCGGDGTVSMNKLLAKLY